jgi:hypothetical protein
MYKRPIALILAIVYMTGAASAHHSWGSYDASRVFTISAPVETLSWADPHVHIMLKYEGATWEATPPEIVDKLNKEINAGLADPTIKARLAELQCETQPCFLVALQTKNLLTTGTKH